MAADGFRVVTIDSDGTTADAEWDTTGGTLGLLQDAVGGFVDVVPLHPTITMWVNDTGLVDALPINWVATTIARAFGLTHQPYVGPVVFTGGTDDDSTTLPLGDHQATTLLRAARLINDHFCAHACPPGGSGGTPMPTGPGVLASARGRYDVVRREGPARAGWGCRPCSASQVWSEALIEVSHARCGGRNGTPRTSNLSTLRHP